MSRHGADGELIGSTTVETTVSEKMKRRGLVRWKEDQKSSSMSYLLCPFVDISYLTQVMPMWRGVLSVNRLHLGPFSDLHF